MDAAESDGDAPVGEAPVLQLVHETDGGVEVVDGGAGRQHGELRTLGQPAGGGIGPAGRVDDEDIHLRGAGEDLEARHHLDGDGRRKPDGGAALAPIPAGALGLVEIGDEDARIGLGGLDREGAGERGFAGAALLADEGDDFTHVLVL